MQVKNGSKWKQVNDTYAWNMGFQFMNFILWMYERGNGSFYASMRSNEIPIYKTFWQNKRYKRCALFQGLPQLIAWLVHLIN
jgi:carbohydrate-binding DOMON domain-containing protein